MKKFFVILILVIIVSFLSGCAAFESSIKEVQSDITGLDRIVRVYESGSIIAEYEGMIRIVPSEFGNKVIFELDGKRYNYYNATVEVIEK